MRTPFQTRLAIAVAVLVLGVGLCGGRAAAADVRMRHQPAQPHSGQTVRITIEPGLSVATDPILEYQVVPPGRYLEKRDPRFEKDWVRQPLARTPDGGYGAELPASVQKHRNLVRYRVRAASGGNLLVPPPTDSEGNLAYFVYDGVPAWSGAVNPAGDPAARERKTFSPDVLTRVPVIHLIASGPAVEEVMWKPVWEDSGEDARHAYRRTGTVVCDGKVYDHVKFRARGGSWRHAMGKNMWKFNFNAGHPLAARDHYGRPYVVPWDKLNLGACIQQGDYRMRGEQGMFEAVTYRLFNLAGCEAPRTHWVHLRVVTDAVETPADQYRGDFWGLYLAVEEIEGEFLREHGLPEGNLYKIDGYQPHAQHRMPGAAKDDGEARSFVSSLQRGGGRSFGPRLAGSDSWWSDTVDLDRYYSYRGIVEAVHHYDIGTGKNYFFYLNSQSRRWQVVPWDVDLTWGEHMYGDGREPFVAAGLLNRGPYLAAYQQRLAELQDLLFNPDQTGRLIDEHAAMIWNGEAALSIADADRAKWDYHPIMSSEHVLSGKSDPGLFYFGKATQRFGVMPALMKSYVQRRQDWIQQLLAGYAPSPSPRLKGPQSVDRSSGTLPLVAEVGEASGGGILQWRLGEVTDPRSPSFDSGKPWHYEIEALWETHTPAEAPAVSVPLKTLVAGHTYRVRVRFQPVRGAASRWSAPVEFVAR